MTEQSREILWFGTTGTLDRQATPLFMNLEEKLPSLFASHDPHGYPVGSQVDFATVKVTCTWSKTISVTNLMIADLRAINQEENYSKISNVLERLSRNWDQREGKTPSILHIHVLTTFSFQFCHSYAALHRCDRESLQC